MPSKTPDSEKGVKRSNSNERSASGRHDKGHRIFDRFRSTKKQERNPIDDSANRVWSVDDLASEMKKLGLEPAGLGRFIASLHKLAVASRVDPSVLATIIKDLSSLSGGEYLSIDQVRSKIQLLADDQVALTKKISELRQEKESIEASLEERESQRLKDEESETTFLQLRKRMQETGISFDDVSRLASMVASAKALDHDHAAIMALLSDIRSAREKKSKAESELEQLLDTKRAAQQRVLELEREAAEKQNILQSAARLGQLGLGSSDLDDLSDYIRMIAKTRNISEAAARERLLSDLQSYYANDQELRTRLRALEALVREKEEKFSILQTDFSNEKAVLENATKLISAGLDANWLLKLRNIIDSYGLDIDALAKELQARSGLSASIDELSKTKRALEEEEKILRQKVVAAEDQRIKTLTLINEMIIHTPIQGAVKEKHAESLEHLAAAAVQSPEFLESARKAIELIRGKLPLDSPARLVLEHALLALKLESKRGN